MRLPPNKDIATIVLALGDDEDAQLTVHDDPEDGYAIVIIEPDQRGDDNPGSCFNLTPDDRRLLASQLLVGLD